MNGWKKNLIGLHQDGSISGETLLEIEVASDVAELLLDLTDSLKVSRAVKVVSAELEELDEVVGDITTGDVETVGQVRERETLVDGDDVGDTITRVHDDSGEKTLGVQDEHGLDGDVDAGEAIGLEHLLHHLFSVSLGVHGRLGQEDLALAGVDLELLVEGVIVEVTHVLPVPDDTVVEGITDVKHRTDLGGLISHHDVLFFFLCLMSTIVFCFFG